MSDYSKATNFAAKDTLSTGNPLKIVKGTEIDNEFNAIAGAIASKVEQGDVDSTVAAAIAAIPAATGLVVQVVNYKLTGVTDTTSTSYVDTFATAAITPTDTGSKIFVIVSSMAAHNDYSGAGVFRLVRGSGSNIISGDHFLWGSNGFTQAPYQTWSGLTLHGVDEPATTSSVTYKVQIKNVNNGSSYFGANDVNGTVFTLLEIL